MIGFQSRHEVENSGPCRCCEGMRRVAMQIHDGSFVAVYGPFERAHGRGGDVLSDGREDVEHLIHGTGPWARTLSRMSGRALP